MPSAEVTSVCGEFTATPAAFRLTGRTRWCKGQSCTLSFDSRTPCSSLETREEPDRHSALIRTRVLLCADGKWC